MPVSEEINALNWQNLFYLFSKIPVLTHWHTSLVAKLIFNIYLIITVFCSGDMRTEIMDMILIFLPFIYYMWIFLPIKENIYIFILLSLQWSSASKTRSGHTPRGEFKPERLCIFALNEDCGFCPHSQYGQQAATPSMYIWAKVNLSFKISRSVNWYKHTSIDWFVFFMAI